MAIIPMVDEQSKLEGYVWSSSESLRRLCMIAIAALVDRQGGKIEIPISELRETDLYQMSADFYLSFWHDVDKNVIVFQTAKRSEP